MEFIIVNGEIIRKEEVNLTHFCWGEPLVISQKMWFGFGGIPLFYENLVFINLQFDALNTKIPEIIRNARELYRIIKRMLNKNKFYRSGIISFQFFIGKLGVNTLITCSAVPEFEFPFHENGLLVDFSEYKKDAENSLNRFGSFNRLQWKAAVAKYREAHFKDSIILNEKGVICESISSNIFFVKDNVLFTPSLETGCYEDTIRKEVFEVARKINLEVSEQGDLTKEDIFLMDEVFLASEENGTRWILGIEGKRYIHKYSVEIGIGLNKLLKNKAS